MFDPKTFTDEEMYTRQLALIERRLQAFRIGRPDIANQLEIMIRAIEYERRERMFVERFAKTPQKSVVLETDPSLREQPTTPIEQQPTHQPINNNPVRPARRPIRTTKPVLPSDGV